MAITRRCFFNAITAALIIGAASPAAAARFADTSGLNGTNFIWQPTLAPSGPVVVIVTRDHDIVHVYRGGNLLGIAKTAATRASSVAPDGVYEVAELSAAGGSSNWVGEPRFQRANLTGASIAIAGVALAPKFAALLAGVTHLGCMIIITSERSATQTVQTFAPFSIGPLSTDRLSSFEFVTGSVSQSAGLLGDENDLKSPVTMIVSRASKRARLLRNGALIEEMPAEIAADQEPIGDHAFSLVDEGGSNFPMRWLAVGLDDTGQSPQVRHALARQALERISFLDPAAASALMREFQPGAALVITDAPLPPATAVNGRKVALLTTSTSAPTQQPSGSVAETRKTDRSARSARKAAPIRAKRAAVTPAKRRSQRSGFDGSGKATKPIVGPHLFNGY